MQASNERYHSLNVTLHWVMLLLIAAVYACIELRTSFPRGSDPRELLKHWHFALGMAVFVLVWLRLIGRLLFRAPAITPQPPSWQRAAASAMHLALYGLMISLPLLGWFILSAGDKTQIFSWLTLPSLVAPDRQLAGQLKEIHEWLGVAGYWLIGLHAAAGVAHHYLLRDNTLTRMLPGRSGN
ncbi:cytochrome b561 [Halopseudomonas oceani]|jgi:cytochrome b561|uniref:Cytochrome B n=1 Tax=Halopseudomonas oceani TaxID=1708783 RepID=A0A2P4ETS8_9GAMM|nr:cytochrome b [Halopseudomonas oceani]POB02693.1 cytochrome B [Halopseudomonas oceani]GGE51423.1 cytochrome b561 [Halopseudomonas oceani]